MRNRVKAMAFLGLSLSAVAGLLTGVAYGQGRTASADVPAVEVSGSYHYVRANLLGSGGCCFSVNGGSGAVAVNLTSWFGLAGEFGAYGAGNVRGSGRSLTLFSYIAGPRLALRRDSRVTPFAHALFGGGHAAGTLYTGPGGLGANNAFNMAIGGGLDIRVSPRVAIRVVQADYFFTKFLNGINNRQNNLRLGAGVVFRLGSR